MSATTAKDIAIIGMACVYPGAEDVWHYWQNILSKVNAISDPPPDWEADRFWEADAKANDRTYCKRGGWLGKLAAFDPFLFGIMPNAVDGAERDHFMALQTAHDALTDAAVRNLEEVKHRTAVIVGRGTYVNRGNAAALQQGVIVDSVLRILKQLHPEHSAEELAEIKEVLQKTAPPFHSDTAPGLVPNIITGRICNRLDLMGPNYLIDAACASSLVAVEIASRELTDGRCDLAIAGGVHADTSPVLMMIFSQLGALSRRGEMRPFADGADGTLLGEGVGMVVLKRLADAERQGDKIYAVLKGIGIASDGRATHVLAPRIEGEEAALRRAYESAGVDPATIGLVEAHGTSTPVGDVVEVEALANVFGDRNSESARCALGSVKSMISHTVPASGMAGLIKAALALHHKVLPPTLGIDTPNPKLRLEKTNFYLNTETRPWIHGATKHPRRAGVNAFGFGGINAHAVLEEYTGPNQASSLQHEWDSELFVIAAESPEGLRTAAAEVLALVSSNRQFTLKDLAWTLNCMQPLGPQRLAIVGKSREDLKTKLERAVTRLADERTKQIKDIEGIYWFREPLGPTGKTAFVFPGEGSQYRNMLGDLCLYFPEVRRTFDLMDRAYESTTRDYLPSDVIFPCPLGSPSQERLWNMDSGAETVFCANQAMYALVEQLGIRADAMVGHSTGEHSALLASKTVGVHNDDELIEHILGVYNVFDTLNKSAAIPEAVLLAIAGADHAQIEQLVAESNGALYIALDNCVHQLVVCGKEEAIDKLMQSLAGSAAICQKLPFARAYHTPWFEVFSKPLKQHFDRLHIAKPAVSLYSCVTASRYPEDADEIRHLASVQWSSAVRFRETVDAMHNDGVRIFIEIGPRSNLTGFIDDVLRRRSYIAIPANVQHRSGILQLNHMLGQLVAHGMNPRLEHLYARRVPKSIDEPEKAKRRLLMASGIQPLRLPQEFALPKPATPSPPPAPIVEPARAAAITTPGAAPVPAARTALMQQHLGTMQQFLSAHQQVMAAYLAGRQCGSSVQTLPMNVHVTPAQPRRPFFQQVTEHVLGTRAVALHTFSRQREIVFEHHTLGLNVSNDDPSLRGLPMVPLTVTMEILAEGGALLEPGKLLTGMRDIRATRWITLEQPGYMMEVTARQLGPGEVHVSLREAGTAGALRPIFAEAICLYGERYPESGPPRPFALENERVSKWKPHMLYATGMFHDSLMRGTTSVERTGRNGTSATLEALPHNQLFTDNAAPAFLFDPILLDAAGQVVAYWFWEAIERGTDLFPYRIAAFHCYAAPPATGSKLECRVVRKFEDDAMIHSDIEVLDKSGKVYYRLDTWETRRFRQPSAFLELRVNPRDSFLAAAWPEPLAGVTGGNTCVSCVRIDQLPAEFLESSHGIWMKALAHLVLSRQERAEWESMQAVSKRRIEWLLGRCAAKDAVRMLIRDRFGVQLCAADVIIVADPSGRPRVEGVWRQRLNVEPVVSITHTGGIAAALAALDADHMVGIDMERTGRKAEQFEGIAFAEEERAWLGQLTAGQREEWALRLWCAKEALGKALGCGLTPGFKAIRVAGAELDTGVVRLQLTDGLQTQFRQHAAKTLLAYTRCEKDLISSTVVFKGR